MQPEQDKTTPDAGRARRATWMIRGGGLALIAAVIAVAGGTAIGWLIGFLGALLFVGGLIVHP